MTNRASRTRLTIGVIMDNVTGESRSSLLPGIADTVKARGASLLCFTGDCLQDPCDFTVRGNVVYEMIDKNGLDGLIIWTSSLASYVSYESICNFCNRYKPLPIVSIGMVLDGIPSVVLDSYRGMREVLTHLITVHQRRRIVFLRGPTGHRDADERYRAYQDTLKEFDLPLIPQLVSPPWKWFDPGGQTMIRWLIDEEHTDFDAVASTNDAMALGAMEVLQTRGIRVPDDVSITGFDNTPVSRLLTPPLTTVPWRMYERGRQATRLILSMLDGEPVPDQVVLPTRLIVRQSCGCLDPAVVQAKVETPATAPTLSTSATPITMRAIILTTRPQCLSAIEQAIDENERPRESVSQFLDAFLDELAGTRANVFLPTLEKILRQVVAIGGDASAWQTAVSILRREMLPALSHDHTILVRAENLWHQARVLIGETVRRARGYREWLARQQASRLRKISHSLATMTTLPALMNVLAEELPQLNISSCYLALYEDPMHPTESCRLVLAYDEKGRIDLGAEGPSLPTRDFAMGKHLRTKKPTCMLIVPLFFQNEQLGLVLFTQQPAGDIYEVLQAEISVTLKGVMLATQNVQLYQQAVQAEQSAQEGKRLAEEANHLKSSFLSMVSHELLTPLVMLVGLSEMMLHDGSGSRPQLPEPYRQDLARIHLSAQQLGNLVRDVLDLTRSQTGLLKLAKKPLDLRETWHAVALIGEQMARSKGLEWQAEIPDCLPKIYGDASRLQQVAVNLISNAVKFTEHGSIKFQVETDQHTITTSISDTGLGVPQSEQDAIFDEFRQSERTVARGYGGLGIGLAICRQLVELHGGQIGVRSSGEEQGGSTFFFTLPVMVESENAPGTSTANPRVVLLLTGRADGNPRVQEFLTQEGFQVESLATDENPNWLSQVLALSPGAVILDCQPASKRGWQLIETLKDNPITQDIPVLFYSLQEQGTGAMLDLDYLTKPVGMATLSNVLQRYGLGSHNCDSQRVILIVDDDPNTLELHTRIVRSSVPDCRVLQAANGRIALDVMQTETPSLVLLDLMMPELDGMGVIAAMQENEKLRGIPVVVLTAQDLTQKEMAQLNRGVSIVLEKGLFTATETLNHIERALERNKRLGGESQRIVSKAIAFIHEHYAEPISRDDIACHIGVSARHLTRCFQQEMNISLITYLNRHRVKKAKHLLEAGEKNITEVAAAVGFSSSNYFTDAFRREMGVSPRDYQRKHSGAG